jgi:hypothetical protein
MSLSVRDGLKQIPGALPAWKFVRLSILGRVWPAPQAAERRIMKSLRIFAPNSAGDVAALAQLTIASANETIPWLARLAANRPGFLHAEPLTAGSLADEAVSADAAEALRRCFVSQRSDKSTVHDYHLLYGPLLHRRGDMRKVLEIGIGTNNEDVVSNMSRAGTPGASLRAFRDFLPQARIYGADIDSRVLFAEERIETFAVDQTDAASLERLGKEIGADFDLIIDDGLHAPHANLAVLLFAMPRVRPGGAVVIEDIPRVAAPLWQAVGALMPEAFECRLFETRSALVFLARRRPNLAA